MPVKEASAYGRFPSKITAKKQSRIFQQQLICFEENTAFLV